MPRHPQYQRRVGGANLQVVHFPDGTFWLMGSLSSGTEQDAGTIYPTVMEDTNGNLIYITYAAGMSLTGTNSSSRITNIEDVRSSAAYSFTYDLSGGFLIPPHLTAITNGIGTGEKYTFAYATQPLQSPFNAVSYGSWKVLQSVTNGINLSTQFAYGFSGGLAKVTMPYGGYLRWDYIANVHAGSRMQMEVFDRYLSKNGGESVYPISWDSGSSTYVRGWATLQDNDGNAKKTWTFQSDPTKNNQGLVTAYQEYDLPSGTLRSENDYTWTTPSTATHPYITGVVTTMDGVSKKTTQSYDQYGNVTQMQLFDWSATAATRTYTNTYLAGGVGGYSSNYTSYYIFNRLLTSTVTDGTKSTALVLNRYDNGWYFTDSPGIREHDSKMNTTWSQRGLVVASTRPDATLSYQYDIAGNVTQMTKNGVQTTVTTNSNTNFAAPSAVATNYSSSMSWNSFLGLTSATGPNGDNMSMTYDGASRPGNSTSPYGAVTLVTYNDSASPPTHTATTNSHWTKTTLDGFGRTIQTDSGDTVTRSTAQAQYAACGCSPLGKMYRQSQPYDPNANGGNPTIYWTTYTYDGLGRTTKTTLPDGSASTYVYAGNNVTVTDPAGKWKKFTMDAFGNVTTVVEPDASQTSTNQQATTTYTYDILNHSSA